MGEDAKVLDQNICHPLISLGARPSYCSFSKIPRRRNKVFTREMQVLYQWVKELLFSEVEMQGSATCAN